MLSELRVKNLALIARGELELGPGLTVLTGETGAGKTALLSSLKLLIGERGDSTMVGADSDEARVEALFVDVSTDVSSPGLSNGPTNDPSNDPSNDRSNNPSDDFSGDPHNATLKGEHLVTRRINTEGRSRCYLDDELVTVGRLSETLGPSVDLYGQHEHQSLLKAAEQLNILDEFIGEELACTLADYQAALARFEDASTQLHKLQEYSSSSQAGREQAAFVAREINKIAPKPGEYEQLEQELPLLSHGEQLSQTTYDVLELLRGSDGVLERLSASGKALEVLSTIDPALKEPFEQLDAYLIELEELASGLGRYASAIEHDPEALQAAMARLGELDGLSRRFGPGMDQVFAQLEQAEQLLMSAEDSTERLAEAEKNRARAREELQTAAAALSQRREAGLSEFIGQLNASISGLALTGASLEFAIQDLPFERWGLAGSQSYELLYRPAPDASARPLAKIASGGELSRVMLAIKGLLQQSQQSMTLVFDEIDAGIGGKTAHAVAERLAHLATMHQVIVITHLAQIAVLADHHFLVDKTTEGTTTRTTIVRLDSDKRVEEVARMLSGSTDAEALTHAQKLLRR